MNDSLAVVPKEPPPLQNLALVELLMTWADRKQARLAQIALGWLLAQNPLIVPISGTTQMAHMIENIGAPTVRL
ncbi:aldo/keto reductase [Ensifer canadensis]